ncbi:MAG: peptidase P60 [Hyphomonadaceae bacterium]|nr:peptidase P60 [Hyphomonadaceae bacterium]
MTRAEILTEARGWLGTPYRHQASVRGAGADCLGFLRGVWRGCVGDEPEAVPAYTPDWAELTGEDTLLAAARRHLVEIPVGAVREGDILLFRMAAGVPAKHCALVSACQAGRACRILHAYWGRGVTETRLVPWWSRRITAAFSFPGLEV